MRPGEFVETLMRGTQKAPASFLLLFHCFLFYCVVFVHPLMDDTVPALRVHSAAVHGTGGDKQLKRDLAGTIHGVVAGERLQVTAVFIQTFLKLDRKQNTRLWPVVAAGTTRSPPEFSI